jgi:hypothetical protein
MGATKAKWRGNQLAFYDGTTYETVRPVAPIYLYDDFLGTAINGDIWTDLDLNNATTTAPAASIFKCEIGQVNENAAAGLYGTDSKGFDMGKGLIFECRLAVHTAPTLTTEIGFGMMNDSYGADSMRFLLADECAKYAFFGFYTTVGAGLTAVVRTDDSSNASGIVSTATTVVLDVYHIYRIDFTDLASVKFYIDGVRVAPATTFKMDLAASLTAQPWIMVYKHDDATTAAAGEFYLDYVKIWQATR